MQGVTKVILLLVATVFKLASCTFEEWKYLDLIDRIDFMYGFRPGFKIEVLHKPCNDTVGTKAKSGDYVYQHYSGSLVTGVVFDDRYSVATKQTKNFILGIGETIEGIDMGMKGMCVGERRRITIPPSLVDGRLDKWKNLPSYSRLIFDVTLFKNQIGLTGHEVIYKPASCERLTAPGDVVTMHYNGTLMDGTSFESTYGDSPINTTVGVGIAIQGLDMNLLDMCVGEVRKIKVQSELAYGDQGDGSTIPPNADLIFEVKLLDIIEGRHEYVKIDGPVCHNKKQAYNDDILEIEYSGISITGHTANNIGRRFRFQVGRDEVPTGLTWGVNSMCVGERRRILMPPEFVDTDLDNAGFPVNKRLTLDIKLLSNNFGVTTTSQLPTTGPPTAGSPTTGPPTTGPPMTLPQVTGPPTKRLLEYP